MKRTMKWIIMLAAAMMLTILAGSAMADDRVYTSPSFRLPGSRIEIPAKAPAAEETEAETETPAVETVPVEAVNETEAVFPESEQEDEAAAEAEMTDEVATEAEAAEEPAPEAEMTEEVTAETEATEDPAVKPETTEEETADTEEPAAEQAEAGEPAAEVPEDAAEPDDYDELTDEPADDPDAWAADPETETVPEERQVLIRSSRRETVTGGEIIELTSRLIGFGDAVVHYQWQVDRNDGAGWVDAEDGNRWKYTFLADRITVMYNWRLIVTVDE